MRPIGKIRIFIPGTTKGSSDAVTRVCIGFCTEARLPVVEGVGPKTPFTKVASLEESVVFWRTPLASKPDRVTVGVMVCLS